MRIFALLSLLVLVSCQSRKERTLVSPSEYVPSHDEKEAIQAWLPDASVGYLALDAATGKVLREQGPDTLFVPASVTKLVTGIGALKVLGADRRFRTSLYYTGKITKKTLEGDIILWGEGDPLFYLSHLMELVSALHEKGVREVKGRFLYDDSALPSMSRVADLVYTETARYNPGFSALTMEFNRLRLRWRDQADGKTEVWPAFPMPTWRYRLIEEKLDDDIVLKESEWSIPTILLDKQRGDDLPVHAPSVFVANVFRELCRWNGITVAEPAPGKLDKKNFRLVYEHKSPTVREIVAASLEHSNNLVAEMLFQQAIKKSPAQFKGLELSNGSGLTTKNRLSPKQVTQLLLKEGVSFSSMLPISGWKGTLRDSHAEPHLSMRVWAKTGTLHYHRGLCGYLFPESNKPVVFCFFSGDTAKRARFESGEKDVVAANGWDDRAKSLENEILSLWVKKL